MKTGSLYRFDPPLQSDGFDDYWCAMFSRVYGIDIGDHVIYLGKDIDRELGCDMHYILNKHGKTVSIPGLRFRGLKKNFVLVL